MEKTNKLYLDVMSVVNKYSRVDKRENELIERGFFVSERRCGSGGKGQIITLKNEIRIQIGYGHGKQNYAKCVIINK